LGNVSAVRAVVALLAEATIRTSDGIDVASVGGGCFSARHRVGGAFERSKVSTFNV
jgi:hypothetical protein